MSSWVVCYLQQGNDFEDPLGDTQFLETPALLLKMDVRDNKIVFVPSLQECDELITQCLEHIIVSAEGLHRVSVKRFFVFVTILIFLYRFVSSITG